MPWEAVLPTASIFRGKESTIRSRRKTRLPCLAHLPGRVFAVKLFGLSRPFSIQAVAVSLSAKTSFGADMKFTDGYWQLRKGVTMLRPAEAFDAVAAGS